MKSRFFGWLFPVLALLFLFANVVTAEAYNISGTVANSSGRTGRVYVQVQWSGGWGGGSTGLGTTIPSPGTGAFTIRGVTPGTYTVMAFMDTQNTGTVHVNDPVAMSGQFQIDSADVPIGTIMLTSPAVTPPVTPSEINAAPGDKGALVMWDTPQDDNGNEIADAYNVYWGTSPTPGPGNIPGGGSRIGIPASGKNGIILLGNQTNGTQLYFSVEAVNAGGTSSRTATSNSALIGPLSGGATVTGRTLSPGVVKGPGTQLFVAVGDPDGGGFYVGSVANPADSQTWTVSGVQPGTYQVYSILDMNNNQIMDTGDLSNTDGQNAPHVTVTGADPVTAPDITLAAVNATASVATVHQKYPGNESYNLDFRIRGSAKRAVNATINSGPNISAPVDITIQNGAEIDYWVNSGARPVVGDAYPITVNYSDGTSEILNPAVTAVLDSFIPGLYPVGNTAPDSMTPLFSWSTPMPLPGGTYGYDVNVSSYNGGNIWQNNNDFPSTQLSVLFNQDGRASQETLSAGTSYYWNITLRDSQGNQSQNQIQFVPQASGPAVTGFTPASGPAGTSGVVINGSGFDTINPANNTVYFGGVQATTVTVNNANQITATVPNNAPVGPVTVTTNGTTAGSPAFFNTTIGYSGSINNSGGTFIGGATVSVAGTEITATSSLVDGSFNIPGNAGILSGLPFSVNFSSDGYLDSYSALQASTSSPSGNQFGMFTATEVAGWGVTLPAKGAIRSRVVDNSSGSNLGGVTVLASSQVHPATPYTVVYTSGGGLGGTKTASDGLYYVLNVDPGDVVTVTGSKSGWSFLPRTFNARANAVGQGKLKGGLLPVIDSLSTSSGWWGQSVTINGSNFACPGTSVSFGTYAAPSPTTCTPTQLVVTIPQFQFLPQIVAVSVTTPSGTTATASTFSVNRRMPTITWSNPADITNPAQLGSAQLNATAVDPVTSAIVAGNYNYNPGYGSTLNAGNNQQLQVYFDPADHNTYDNASKSVSINVLAAGPATMVFPANATTLAGTNQDFTWTNSGANLYQVWVGTTPGASDIGMFPPAGTTGTSTAVSGLPAGGTMVYVRLWSQIGSNWSYNDYSYTASGSSPAAMVTPINTTTLAGASQTFTWTNSGASLYQVWVGTTSGASDIGMFPPNGTAATTTTATGLPTGGSTLYVRLWSKIGPTWSFSDYTYTAAGIATGATMVAPVNTSALAGASQTFTWTNSGASLYQVWVGTTTGASDIGMFPPAGTAATTTTVTGLPTGGSTLYVRLWSKIGSTWSFNDYTYTAAGIATAATMITPVNTSILAGASQTFTWTNSGASLYQVWVGTTSGASDIGMFPPAGTTAATTTVTGLPANGSTLYVRLWSKVGATWSFNDYTYTAASGTPTAATMVTPVNGGTISGASQFFTWTNTGANLCQLWAGTAPGASDLGMFPPAGTTGTSTTTTGLPSAGTVYVRLWTQVNGSWIFNDYTYTAGP